jgi:hypothetical protein
MCSVKMINYMSWDIQRQNAHVSDPAPTPSRAVLSSLQYSVSPFPFPANLALVYFIAPSSVRVRVPLDDLRCRCVLVWLIRIQIRHIASRALLLLQVGIHESHNDQDDNYAEWNSDSDCRLGLEVHCHDEVGWRSARTYRGIEAEAVGVVRVAYDHSKNVSR